jgi:inosine-uridine nucleoside N-ribohydrolase
LGLLTRRHLLALSTAALANPALAAPASQRVILDVDPGVDDGLAILLALRSPELKVEALTAVAGNVALSTTLPNALRLLEIAGRGDIPVAAGADKPLRRRLMTAAYAHGNNGLGGVDFPAPALRPVAEPAAALIRRMVRAAPGQITLVALGPLTNLATAFAADPGLPRLVKGITVMGGSLSGGNITPAAEFNFYTDPEAARAVFRSGAAIRMVGLDVTRKAAFSEAQIARLEQASTPWGRASGRIMRASLEANRRSGADGGQARAHDSMALASLIDPSLFTWADVQVEIETAGTLTAGMSLGYRRTPRRRSALLDADAGTTNELSPFAANAQVAMEVEAERFMDLLIGRLTAA